MTSRSMESTVVAGPLADEGSVPAQSRDRLRQGCQVAIFTGGLDKPYALGMAAALGGQQIPFDFIASDALDVPEVRANRFARFLNLRGDQNPKAGLLSKVFRVLACYANVVRYAVRAEPRIFHLLWHNKFHYLDRTVIQLLFKLLGKRLVLTAHNVNAGKRDGNDSWLNRATLRFQYRTTDHVFVHTERMKKELVEEFPVRPENVTVIPFGINQTIPQTGLTAEGARRQLGIGPAERTILFFGNIAPYKGLEYLLQAYHNLAGQQPETYRLIIVGQNVKCDAEYWKRLEVELARGDGPQRILKRIEYVPDEKVEPFLKAADLLVLPYTHIFQSGVLFLGYNFGLPVIVTDVGSLKDDVLEGETGFVCPPRDAAGLQRSIETYFNSDLYRNLAVRRPAITQFAQERYSWEKVARMTAEVYTRLLEKD